MKKYIITTLVVLLSLTSYAQVGIGTTTPNAEAALHIDGDKKSLLLPRMTTAERPASPAPGLMIFNTSINCVEYWNGTEWDNMCSPTCDNDITTNADINAPIVQMMYDYDGNGTAEYTWCARELGIDLDNADGDNNLRTGVDQTYLDRDLGAYRAAGSSTDFQGYGDLYQWGRAMDGHHKINWTNSTSGSPENGIWNDAGVTTVTPNDVRFIEGDDTPTSQNFDWHDNNVNNERWDAAPAVNDPCPTDYHVPTGPELQSLQTYISDNGNNPGAAFTALKLPMAGYRVLGNGSLDLVGIYGIYWSSTGSGKTASALYFYGNGSGMFEDDRGDGYPVRCLKD